MNREHICFIIWPPTLKHSSLIIDKVKNSFEFLSYKIYRFNNNITWMELINIIYILPLESQSAKRYKKSEGLNEYNKEVGVVEFYVSSNSNDVINIKNSFRNNIKNINRYHILHSTESTEHTIRLLENLNTYCER